MKKNNTILVITPILHIEGLMESLKKSGKLIIFENPSKNDLRKILIKANVIFTNPNKSKIYIGKDLIDKAINLKVICTASTGTNHIDVNYARSKKIKIISLTKDYNTIKKISSTAEHALALTLSSLRNIPISYDSVLKGNWDYTKYIGRQINFLTIGVVGYGRLGKMYARYLNSMGSKVIFYDPFKKSISKNIKKISSLNELFMKSDVISFHLHVNTNTHHLLNKKNFKYLKKDVLIINTSRGEIINEKDLIMFLKKNKKAKYSCDVLENEIFGIGKNKLIKYAEKNKKQVTITPHIGGMTKEAQNIAYHSVSKKLTLSLKK